MSARDRRLREAAAERDRQESDTDQSSFDRGLRQAAESRRSDSARNSRPSRDPAASADEPTFSESDPARPDSSPDSFDDIDRSGDGGGGGRPSPQPDAEDEQSIAEQIGELEPGEVLTATGGGGTGEADVEVISEEESRQRVREAQIVARTDLTRSELEASQRFARQQTEFELLGRVEAQLEDRFGDIDFRDEDVRITERDGLLRAELTDRFVEEDLPQQVGLGAEADFDEGGAFLGPEGRPGDIGGRETDQTPGERLRDVEAGLTALDRSIAETGAQFFGQGAALAESRQELEGFRVGTVVRRAGAGLTGLARIPTGLALLPFETARQVSPAGIEARQQRAEEIGTVDVPTGGGFLPGDELDFEQSESELLTTIATFDEDIVDPAIEFAREREGGIAGAAIELGAGLGAGAAVFRAGAAIGPRAGTATRFAIQPGEEILGRGGFAATRRLRGEETAQRLFPQQEPLIFSEEAALRGINRAADRAQQEIDRINIRAPGVFAGVPRLEVEIQERRTVTEPELRDPADIEMEERLLAAEQRRVVPMQDRPPRSDLTPQGTILPARGLDPRTRARLEASRRAELEAEAESEREVIRTQLGLDLEQEQVQEPFEFETFDLDLEQESELPPREIELPPIETEVPPRETEGPPRETERPPEETEAIELPDLEEDLEDDLFQLQQLQLEGVQAVEAVLDPGELDIE